MKRIGILGAVVFVALFGWRFASGGTNTLSSVSGGRVQTSHVNQFYTALNQDVVPRNSSGAPTNIGGSLGSSTYAWLKVWVESGYWSAGDIKMHHTYNGTVGCGQGWMVADGDVINETNYDAEHGAGSWDTYVVSSPLDGKYLPNFNGKYATGANTTTQAGTIAITSVGNASNVINIQHSHTVDSHTHAMDHLHQTFNYPTGAAARCMDLNGSFVTIGTQSVAFNHFQMGSSVTQAVGDCYSSPALVGGTLASRANTDATSPGTTTSLSSSQSIRPESIEVQFCMRVIE